MVVVGISLIGVTVVGVILIGLWSMRSPSKKAGKKEDKKEIVYSSKKTEELVDDYSAPRVSVDSAYESLGVRDAKSSEEYQRLIEKDSRVLNEGVGDVPKDEIANISALLTEALGKIERTDSYASSSPALSAYIGVLNSYFSGYSNNPMVELSNIFLHTEVKVNILNVAKTSGNGDYVYEFIVEDAEGKQLAYVTGHYGRYTQRFSVYSAFALGYGQKLLNESVPSNLPPKQGLD